MPSINQKFLRNVAGAFFGAPGDAPEGAPEPGNNHERRRLNRGTKRVPIHFYNPSKVARYHGVLLNGSGGGAFIETNDTLPLLTKLRVEGPGIVFHAEVCRVHWLGPHESNGRSGMAVRLLPESQVCDADYQDKDGTVLSIGKTNQSLSA